MKVFYENKIAKLITFFRNCKTISLFGVVLTEKKYLDLESYPVEKSNEHFDLTDYYHEKSHCSQYAEFVGIGLILAMLVNFGYAIIDENAGFICWWLFPLSFILMYIHYILEWIIRQLIFIYKGLFDKSFKYSFGLAYKTLSLEYEAYKYQKEYCKQGYVPKSRKSLEFVKYIFKLNLN